MLQKNLRNPFLLIASLFFYAWGEHFLVLLMMTSISVNYIVGLSITYSQKHFKEFVSDVVLSIGIALNISVLIYYKYTHFILENLKTFGFELNDNIDTIILPIGVSFFTFQNISYLIDVYRKHVPSQKNLIDLGLYISLFPQLIAGPIVRYSEIYKELKERIITKKLFQEGITRFIKGLAKKVILANTVGIIADKTFAIPVSDLSSSIAWVAIICYSLQIYFDFSGYSDMAIGLGKMLGFNFRENFNYPYTAKSVQDFWRRWHISLSTWFRDYLYFPLGGNQKGRYRTYVNLIIVFFITGLWHGANWNFVVWGLYHGAFLIIERVFPRTLPPKFDVLKRVYLFLVIIVGWVFFRSDNLVYALDFIQKMFSFSAGENLTPLLYLNSYTYFVIMAGFLFATPLRPILRLKIIKYTKNKVIFIALKYSFYLLLFILTVSELAQTTYNPFIYFRF